MPDLGNVSVFFEADASNNSGTMPSWNGSAAPSTIDDAGRALQGAVTREWTWRSFTETAGGTADAKTLTYGTAPAAYYTGQKFAFIANTANTGTCTLNVNALGAKVIKRDIAGVATVLAAGDMPSGRYVEVTYNGTDFIWTNGLPGAASLTASGIVELATGAETIAGTDTTRAVRPFGLATLWTEGSDIADGATITIGDGGYFTLITSTTAITLITVTNDKAGRKFFLEFDTIRTLTDNASIDVPGGSYTTAQGDVAHIKSNGDGTVKVMAIYKANGKAAVDITLGTSQATTSGTSIDFTGIPAWARRVTINFAGVSTSGANEMIIQLGDSGGFETTSYSSYSNIQDTVAISGGANFTTGFGIALANLNTTRSGSVTLTLMDASTNTWAASGFLIDAASAKGSPVAGSKSLSATLTQVRITTVAGAQTFDAGSINIAYE